MSAALFAARRSSAESFTTSSVESRSSRAASPARLAGHEVRMLAEYWALARSKAAWLSPLRSARRWCAAR